jgi:HAD superfamily hydrolase (TIGR01509 family)
MLDSACASGGRCVGTLADEIERIDAQLDAQRGGAFTIDDAVERFMRERGAVDAGAWPQRYREMCLEMVAAFVIPEPGAHDLLFGLRERGIRSAILTNGWSPLQQAKALRAGFEGPVIVSADVGVQKPYAEAFGELARVLHAPLASIAFVGDTAESDVAGALAVGMTAVWFDAERRPYPKDIPAPTEVIHSLTELLDLL